MSGVQLDGVAPCEEQEQTGVFLQTLEKVIGDQGKVIMKGNKVHTAAATGEEKNGDLFLEAATDITRCKDNLLGFSRGKLLRLLVILSSLEMLLGLLVLVLNVIFIFFGRNTGWYYFVDSLGTELKVISVGEGIVSGTLYLVLAAASLAILLRKPGHAGALYCTKAATIAIAVVLIVTIACQIGLVHQFAPFDEAFKLGEAKLDLIKEEVYRQTVVLGLQMASHFVILSTSISALIFL